MILKYVMDLLWHSLATRQDVGVQGYASNLGEVANAAVWRRLGNLREAGGKARDQLGNGDEKAAQEGGPEHKTQNRKNGQRIWQELHMMARAWKVSQHP